MKKIKNKKKSVNKTEPSIRVEQETLAGLPTMMKTSSVIVQTYEIKYLNSLVDLNKKLREQRRQSLSLKRNESKPLA